MYIYNPNNEPLIPKRIKEAESILKKIKIKHAFITGSFLYKKDSKDIDIFIISRSKKKIAIQGASITRIDFNDLYSLFFTLSQGLASQRILSLANLSKSQCQIIGV